MDIHTILHHTSPNYKDLTYLLRCTGEKEEQLFAYSQQIRKQSIGTGVYLRGLIEISNVCRKNCFYCGIRQANKKIEHYTLSDREIIESALFAWNHHYGSIVLQGGEQTDKIFIKRIGKLLKEIKQLTNYKIGITLSLGEQTADTYKFWYDCGAHRYLLRIETSNKKLYEKLHPHNTLHSFYSRIECLQQLQRCGYQTGTGVMIGLPFQEIDDLAKDLLFFKSLDIDMIGMGPYLEHYDTPLFKYKDSLLPQKERLQLSLRMISVLRWLMPDINIAATTALQAILPDGREKALSIGANIIMPNITPVYKRKQYQLYENKPGIEEEKEESIEYLVQNLERNGYHIIFNEWGDSKHYHNKPTSKLPEI